MKVLFISGTTASGKTTFLEQFSCPTYSTGKACRLKYGESFFRKKGGFAPDVVDVWVCGQITSFLLTNDASSTDFCIIEGFPRKPDQIQKVLDIRDKYSFDVQAVFLLVEKEERSRRASSRYQKEMLTKDGLDGELKRMDGDEELITQTVDLCRDVGILTIEFRSHYEQRAR